MGATVNGGRVLICDPGCPRELIRDILPQADVGTVADAGPGTVALLVSPEAPVTAADIARAPDLTIIATASVGTDHIDTAAAAARGIAVATVPDYCVEEVSDHALAMIVALRRGLIAGDRSVQAGGWDWTAVGVLGRLREMRLGIVGMGRIGGRLAAKATALGMDVRHHDPCVPGGIELEELLAWADAVSLHVPLTDETRGLIDRDTIERMRDGAIFVNVGRGKVVDEPALIDALRSGKLAGAALDVTAKEPLPPDSPLWELENVILSPHTAALSWHENERIVELFAENLRRYLRGDELLSRVRTDAYY